MKNIILLYFSFVSISIFGQTFGGAGVGISAATQTSLNLKEDLSNKQNTLTTSATKYPTVDAVNTGLALKQNTLNGTGFIKITGTTISYDNSTYLTGINSSQVTTALGFTPYNATNPSGYISSVPAQSFASLTGKPTTIAGYGITDFNTTGDARYLQKSNNLSDLANVITARTNLGLGTLATQNGTFSGISSGTNTGDNAVNTLYSGLVTNATHTGDVTGATALTISNLAVTNAKIANSTIDLTSKVTGVLPIANGGTNNSTAYTNGSIIFSNGTSLAQNNTNLFWDNTNNKLGVGTNSPIATILTIGNFATSVASGNVMAIGGNNTETLALVGSSVGSNLSFFRNGTIGREGLIQVLPDGSGTKFVFYNRNTAGATDNARFVISANGNVGIGTGSANGNAKLEVNSGVANTSGVRLTNLTSASPTTTGQSIGVDNLGNIVTISNTTLETIQAKLTANITKTGIGDIVFNSLGHF